MLDCISVSRLPFTEFAAACDRASVLGTRLAFSPRTMSLKAIEAEITKLKQKLVPWLLVWPSKVPSMFGCRNVQNSCGPSG